MCVKGKELYLLTFRVIRYSFLPLQDFVAYIDIGGIPPGPGPPGPGPGPPGPTPGPTGPTGPTGPILLGGGHRIP